MKFFFESLAIIFILILVSCSDEDGDPGIIINEPQEQSFCEIGRNDLLFTCFRTGVFDLKSTLSQNPIFLNTELIEIPQYSYPAPPNPNSTLGGLVEVSGDSSLEPLLTTNNCCEISGILDRFPENPSFQWNSTNSSLVAVAVFEAQVVIAQNGERIENIEDVVWTWNSGMAGEVISSGKTIVDFELGRDVEEGNILATTTSLKPNTVYIWAVWAWNESGTEITFSSRSIPFVVEQLPSIALTEPEQLTQTEGRWNIISAINQATNEDLTENFPIQSFSVDLNCNVETGEENPTVRTFPENLGGVIDTTQNQVILDSITFSNIVFPCDERLSAVADFDDMLLDIIYESQ